MPIGTAAGTNAGADDQPTSSEDESEYRPPCRMAEQTLAACPICWRQMRIKTLRYSHRCARTFHNDERAAEQLIIASAVVRARMCGTEQLQAHAVEQKRRVERPEEHLEETRPKVLRPASHQQERALEQGQRNYAHLLNF